MVCQRIRETRLLETGGNDAEAEDRALRGYKKPPTSIGGGATKGNAHGRIRSAGHSLRLDNQRALTLTSFMQAAGRSISSTDERFQSGRAAKKRRFVPLG